jgi:hypothetical protein
MSDTNERSCASRGSHDEPIGHQHVDEYGHPSGFLWWRDGETRWPKSQTVPLYLAPQPTLTDEEREAMSRAAVHYESQYDDYRDQTDADTAKTIRGILARLK